MALSEPQGADWELSWPHSLFVAETNVLLQRSATSNHLWSSQVELLLSEAFSGPVAVEAFQRTANEEYSDGFVRDDTNARRQLLAQLANAAASGYLTETTEPRPYFSTRRLGIEHEPMSREATRRNFILLVENLHQNGYLDMSFPTVCVDDNTSSAVVPAEVLEERLGKSALWPLQESEPTWDDDTFLDLVEVFHDLVARPRYRSWHDYGGCGYHWSSFAREPAQVLYRWRINRLLARSALQFRLANSGEDRGRLIAVTDTGRTELTAIAAARTDAGTGDRVRHALALFRARGADEHSLRSAVIALAGVLEERRTLLETSLARKDEAALFRIANEFSIRHQRAGQRSDYRPAFLNWLFWWYLATIELTDELLDDAPSACAT